MVNTNLLLQHNYFKIGNINIKELCDYEFRIEGKNC